LVIGWIGIVLLTMQVANAEIKTATWDPYEIMGIKEVINQNIICLLSLSSNTCFTECYIA
jgi:preprotein translocase subunit Sec63